MLNFMFVPSHLMEAGVRQRGIRIDLPAGFQGRPPSGSKYIECRDVLWRQQVPAHHQPRREKHRLQRRRRARAMQSKNDQRHERDESERTVLEEELGPGGIERLDAVLNSADRSWAMAQ